MFNLISGSNKKSYYILVPIYNWKRFKKFIKKKKILILNIALTFFLATTNGNSFTPINYKRFSIRMNYQIWVLSKSGAELFLKSYNFFLTLIQTSNL